MRRAMVVLCLLMVSPASVVACWEDAPEQTGWLQEPRASYRGPAVQDAEEMTAFIGSMAGAGVASVFLVVVSFVAFTRASGRGRMLPTAPVGEAERDRRRRESPAPDPGLQPA